MSNAMLHSRRVVDAKEMGKNVLITSREEGGWTKRLLRDGG
jgi:hypothetical protein